MSYKKASKKDEQELKAYVEAKAEVTTAESQPKTDVKGLQKALENKGLSLPIFASKDELYRKKVLGEDYAAFKLKYGWLYDQPIAIGDV